MIKTEISRKIKFQKNHNDYMISYIEEKSRDGKPNISRSYKIRGSIFQCLLLKNLDPNNVTKDKMNYLLSNALRHCLSMIYALRYSWGSL